MAARQDAPRARIIVWLGCTVLVVRGGAGIIDDLTRAVGLLPNGITGLSHKQTMGAAYYRSASAIWSANVTDGYFLAGGIILACWAPLPALAAAGDRDNPDPGISQGAGFGSKTVFRADRQGR